MHKRYKQKLWKPIFQNYIGSENNVVNLVLKFRVSKLKIEGLLKQKLQKIKQTHKYQSFINCIQKWIMSNKILVACYQY